MKELKTKICRMPKCNKEIYDSKSFFCREHERAFREFLKKSGMGIATLSMAAVAFITKSIMDKK